MNRRRQLLVTLEDGRIVDTAVLRDYLADLDRRSARPTIERLSKRDPEIVAFEATSRGSRA